MSSKMAAAATEVTDPNLTNQLLSPKCEQDAKVDDENAKKNDATESLLPPGGCLR